VNVATVSKTFFYPLPPEGGSRKTGLHKVPFRGFRGELEKWEF